MHLPTTRRFIATAPALAIRSQTSPSTNTDANPPAYPSYHPHWRATHPAVSNPNGAKPRTSTDKHRHLRTPHTQRTTTTHRHQIHRLTFTHRRHRFRGNTHRDRDNLRFPKRFNPAQLTRHFARTRTPRTLTRRFRFKPRRRRPTDRFQTPRQPIHKHRTRTRNIPSTTIEHIQAQQAIATRVQLRGPNRPVTSHPGRASSANATALALSETPANAPSATRARR